VSQQFDSGRICSGVEIHDFHTKHELGAALLTWFLQALRA
jgi:hypothetical protein